MKKTLIFLMVASAAALTAKFTLKFFKGMLNTRKIEDNFDLIDGQPTFT